MNQFKYSGTELSLFENARNWKRYWSEMVRPYVGEFVLEVGGGIGATVQLLSAGNYKRWVCLEPDAALCAEIVFRQSEGLISLDIDVRCCTIMDMDVEFKFDTILYIDVLEHIRADAAELIKASSLLRQNGFIVIISPAHNFLYSPFDEKIGHYRRYDKKSLKSIIPDDLKIVEMKYLDSVGYLASLINKLVLKTSDISFSQVWFWDKFMVSLSRFVDYLSGNKFGKSIVCVLKK